MVGEPDQSVGYDGVVAIGTSLTRDGIAKVAPSSIGGNAGLASFDRYSGAPLRIAVSDQIALDKVRRVIPHEVGHVIDEVAGQISTAGLNTELRTIYNHLNNPQNYGKRFGPEQNGYRGTSVQRELMVEAVRAYLFDPNYTKTVGPMTAARIRDAVNSNPKLRDLIQFNSIAPIATGGAALGFSGGVPAVAGDDDQQP